MKKSLLKSIWVIFMCAALIVGCSKETVVDDGFNTGNIDFNQYYNKSYENIIAALDVSK